MKRSHLLVCVGLVLFIVAGLTSAVWVWRHQERQVARAELPPVPDLERWPADFKQQIQQATAAAADSSIEHLGRLACLYFVNGFDNEARQILAGLRHLEPQNARWPYLQADLHLRANDQSSAQQALEAVVDLDPNYMPAWLKLGNVRTALGAFAQAEPCYLRAVALAPGNVRAEFALISFEAWHGKLGDPRRSLTALVQAHPGLKELHKFLAQMHAAAGDVAAAETQGRLAAATNASLPNEDPWIDSLAPQCFDPYRLAIVVSRFVGEQRVAEAEFLLKRAITFAPSDGILRRSLAEIYELQQRPTDALAAAEQAVQACPDDARLHEYLAQLLCLQQRPEDAIAKLRPALQRWPTRGALHAALGFALRQSGQTEQALLELRAAVQLDPNLVEAHYWLGFCLLSLGQRDQGVAAVEKLLAMRPDHPEALALLGSLAIEAGEVADAERHINRLYAVGPGASDAKLLYAALHLLKGRIAVDAGDHAGADELFRSGLAAMPEFAPLLRERGTLAFRRERFAEAADALGRYAQLQPNESDTYVLLGNALARVGRNAPAREAYERGLAAAQRAGDQSRIAEFNRLLGR